MISKKRKIKTGLTLRDLDVVRLLFNGLTNKQIAEKLSVSEKTVKYHLTNIYRILNVKSDRELLGLMLKLKIQDEKEISVQKLSEKPRSKDDLPAGYWVRSV